MQVTKMYGMYGIDLADPNDPDKAFQPNTKGIVLGICYDTDEGFNGTWYLREVKKADIVIMLEKAIVRKESNQKLIKSLCGKLLPHRSLKSTVLLFLSFMWCHCHFIKFRVF